MDPLAQLQNWVNSTSNWAKGASDVSVQNSIMRRDQAEAAASAERQNKLSTTQHHQAALADRERRQQLAQFGQSLGIGNLGALNWDRSGPVSAKDLVTIRTSAGNVTVNRQAAKDFQNFINQVEKRGYDIKSLGGYNPRKTRNGDLWSMHSGGYAIDINPAQNPHTGKLITDMPPWMVDLGRKYNLYWGGNWKSSKDPMHWSWGYSG
jgi:LAS superfamily LD-carboxypeptidase LdcB